MIPLMLAPLALPIHPPTAPIGLDASTAQISTLAINQPNLTIHEPPKATPLDATMVIVSIDIPHVVVPSFFHPTIVALHHIMLFVAD